MDKPKYRKRGEVEAFIIDHEPTSVREVMEKFGITRQRVHQIVGKTGFLREILDREKTAKKAAAAEERQRRRDVRQFFSEELHWKQRARFKSKKYNSKRDKYTFDLEFDDLDWPSHCPILGIELDYVLPSGKRNESSASFDRIDPALDYVKGNVAIMSWRANRIKNNGTADEHYAIAEWMEEQEDLRKKTAESKTEPPDNDNED